jgi:hypothetical protein
MASGKNPSIYDDRGAIGSSEELDEYGVWVKSGPQDISEESLTKDFSLDDFSGDEDANVSLDLSRDFSFSAQEDLPDFANFTGTEVTPAEDAPVDDGGISDFGEFNFESPEDDDAGVSFETTEHEGAGVEDQFEDQFIDGSMDIDIPLDTESDETMDFDSFPEIGADLQDSAEAPASAGEISFAEINPGEDEALNFEDLPGSFFEETTGETGSPESSDSFGSSDSFESGDDFTISFDDNTGFPEIPGEESPADGESGEISPPGAAPDAEESGVSTQLLLRIVNELSSIKTELSSLKKELTTARGEVSREEHDAQSPGGFFDESEDEKIALTGAEMDNILQTASFTEEAGSDAVDGAGVEEPEAQTEPESIAIEIDMDEFGPEPVITPYEEEDLSEDVPGLSEDLIAGLETELSTEPSVETPTESLIEDYSKDSPALAGETPVEEITAPNLDSDELFSDALSLDLLDDSGATISDLPDELSVDTGILSQDLELSLDDEVSPEGEISDLDLDADLSLDLPLEDREETAGIFDSSVNNITGDDSFARLIPEGFEEKPADLPLHTEDTLEDDELLDAGILSEDESLDTGLLDGDISVITETDDSMGLDAGFELDAELDEDVPAGDSEIPEVSLDLGAEFDAASLAAEEDLTIDIPADTEGGEDGGEEPVEFDFTEEPLESLDDAVIEDTESLLDNISFEEPEIVAEEVFPDIALEDEPAVELPEEESLSTDFGEFSVEAREDALDVEIPAESERKPPASPLPAEETGVSRGGTLANVPVKIREELKTVLTYMDQLLESLPEEKIEEFAKSEYFDTYKKLFEDLGLV